MPFVTTVRDGVNPSSIPAMNEFHHSFVVSNYAADGGCLDNECVVGPLFPPPSTFFLSCTSYSQYTFPFSHTFPFTPPHLLAVMDRRTTTYLTTSVWLVVISLTLMGTVR